MRRVLLMMSAIVMALGCHHIGNLNGDAGPDTDTDTDTDTDSIECNKGAYISDFTIGTQSDLSILAGYTSISGNLTINCPLCTYLGELICLNSVSMDLWITGNEALTGLDGLSALTSVGEELGIVFNSNLPDCEACDILDQLTSGPTDIDVYDNLDDSCTPVPDNCP